VKEHPIIFSARMVRAILEGKKTQTRRVIGGFDGADKFVRTDGVHAIFTDGILDRALPENAPHLMSAKCQYGKVGDRLWVRETCMYGGYFQGILIKYAIAGGEYIGSTMRISSFTADPEWMKFRERYSDKWCPSIFMPRWASRVTLEITGVRAERVRSIAWSDAYAEGISGGDWLGDPIGEYAKLWDSINAKRGYSWDSNPWVWVIEFRRVEGEQ